MMDLDQILITTDLCTVVQLEPRPEKQTVSDDQTTLEKGEDAIAYGPCMVVERKSRRNSRNNVPIIMENKEKGKSGS
ncbi:hypothetical protein J1N35_023210 [Gossypium stocksii]|uniref:Uncharacterized protein n=1 Tax=Gossypium stocksii TaxID=47602 RepID=A0A9D3VJT8_9ROSI|nr:hypothetical protein J1N35_023210 [Gossypium stocksii]